MGYPKDSRHRYLIKDELISDTARKSSMRMNRRLCSGNVYCLLIQTLPDLPTVLSSSIYHFQLEHISSRNGFSAHNFPFQRKNFLPGPIFIFLISNIASWYVVSLFESFCYTQNAEDKLLSTLKLSRTVVCDVAKSSRLFGSVTIIIINYISPQKHFRQQWIIYKSLSFFINFYNKIVRKRMSNITIFFNRRVVTVSRSNA